MLRLCLRHKPTKLVHSFLFCSRVYFFLRALSTVFHSINCPYNSPYSDSGLISALLVLSTICLFRKVSFSPDIIPSGWLGSEHTLNSQLTLLCCCCCCRCFSSHSLLSFLLCSFFFWVLLFEEGGLGGGGQRTERVIAAIFIVKLDYSNTEYCQQCMHNCSPVYV